MRSPRLQHAESLSRITDESHQDPQVRVVAFSAELIESSVRLYEGRADKNWSLTDCYSFVVMEQHRIKLALTTDHHFEQAGATAVLLQSSAEPTTDPP